MACGKVKASILVENNTMALDKYICPKCDNILTDAAQTSCGHWLCHDCAEQGALRCIVGLFQVLLH